MFDKRVLKNFDFVLFIVAILIALMSTIVILSASHSIQTGSYKQVEIQLIAILIGIIFVIILGSFDYSVFSKYSLYIYFINIIMLVSVFFIGKEINGAKSWIVIGPISFEPAEFSKIFLILTLSNILKEKEKIKTFKELSLPLIHVGIPFVIVMLQRSLGTALVFIAIFLGMVYISGIKPKIFMEMISAGIALMPIAYKVLKPYQKARLLSFINPNIDPMGSGYHVIQSIIAVGSGMLLGKGLFHGSQTQLYYLPESSTDFIFSSFAEEFGFIGAIILIILYGILLYRSLEIALKARDKYGCLIATGIISMFVFHIFENIGMTIGIMPIAGIPLPFMSYGGTAMVNNMIALGFLLNIGMRKYKINF